MPAGRYTCLVIIFFLLVTVLVGVFLAATPVQTPVSTTITIAAVGDIMMGTDYPEKFLPPEDGRHLFRDAEPFLRQADLAFANLEGPLLDRGNCYKDTSQAHVFAFKTPARFARNLAKAGFDVVSLANNHSRDFGEYGLKSTREILQIWGINGISDKDTAVYQRNNISVCFVAFSFSPGSFSLIQPGKALTTIETQAKKYNIVVASFHCGSEGPAALHLTDTEEIFCGEKRGFPKKLGRDAVQKGADLVLMHGPHVPRAMEIYHGRLIAYSLGNFCTYGFSSLKGPVALAPLLLVKLDSQGSLLQAAVISFRQVPPGIPRRDFSHQALHLLRKLSREDLSQPETFLKSDVDFFLPGKVR